jgi:hypothetical protein
LQVVLLECGKGGQGPEQLSRGGGPLRLDRFKGERLAFYLGPQVVGEMRAVF